MADPTYQPKVYRQQGATAFVVASGGTLSIEPGGNFALAGEFLAAAGSTMNLASGALRLPTNLRRGYIPLSMFAARSLSSAETIGGVTVTASTPLSQAIGGLLHAGSTPTLTMNSSDNHAAILTWASGVVTAVAFPPLPIPPDFSSAGGLSIHAIAERTSDAASNNVLDFRFWANENTSNKGTTGSTMTSTPAEYSITVSSAEVGAHPGTWNITIVPGTHTNNAVRMWNSWVEYDRRTS